MNHKAHNSVSRPMPYLICYDISDDSKRQKVADTLVAFGCYRLQKSVFAGDLSDVVFRDLFAWLKKIRTDALMPTDSVLLLSVTLPQLQGVIHLGAVPPDWVMLTQPPNTLII